VSILTDADFRQRMRVPVIVTGMLLLGLVVNVTLAALLPFRGAWIVELLVVAAQVGTVLWVSMEVKHEPPLMQLFALVGFMWVAILFGLTLLDYLTR